MRIGFGRFLNIKEIKHGKNILQPQRILEMLFSIKKLAKEAKVSEKQALEFLKKQAVWQFYLLAPKKIIRPRFDVSAKNEVHQADLLFLPYDIVKVGRANKTYRYALTLVDVGTRYKEAGPLTSGDSK